MRLATTLLLAAVMAAPAAAQSQLGINLAPPDTGSSTQQFTLDVTGAPSLGTALIVASTSTLPAPFPTAFGNILLAPPYLQVATLGIDVSGNANITFDYNQSLTQFTLGFQAGVVGMVGGTLIAELTLNVSIGHGMDPGQACTGDLAYDDFTDQWTANVEGPPGRQIDVKFFDNGVEKETLDSGTTDAGGVYTSTGTKILDGDDNIKIFCNGVEIASVFC